MTKWMRRLALSVGVLLAIMTGAVAWAYPTLAAAACPGCYGMERVAPGLIVEASMETEVRRRVTSDLAAAHATVAAFYDGLDIDMPAVIVACATEPCDRRLGGLGARATIYSTPFGSAIRVAPRGLDRTILTHEMAHVALHRRIGVHRQMSGAVPAWFDEGLAILISKDARYIRPGRGRERCVEEPDGPLPANPFEWAPLSGRDPMVYAKAACAVVLWMEENGGRAGLLAAIERGEDLP